MIRIQPHKQTEFRSKPGQIINAIQGNAMKKKVYIQGGNYDYHRLFEALGFEIVDRVDLAELICFTGGEDVSPKIYGDRKHPQTFNNPLRDHKEAELFRQAVDKNIPMVGICRGGQFLNVMSGGRMYQHVDKHTDPHFLTDLDSGEEIYVSSTHHQMMMPSDRAQIVAASYLGGSREWYDGEVFKRDISNQDIEVVYYEHTNALCFQPHPEFDAPEYGHMKEYFRKLLSRFLKV